MRIVPLVSIAGRIALVAISWLALSARVDACSMCRCGDPTFNALGKDGYAAVGWRLALDWERFDKDEGDPAVEVESQVENRWTALVSYGASDRLTIVARLPFSSRELAAKVAGVAPARTETGGAADPEIYAQWRLWASPFRGELGRRASLSVSAGVKTPWGENDLRQGGERVDEHAQPGTGSTDLFGSLAMLYLIDGQSALFASAGYRRMGANDSGYRYGDVALASAAYEHKIGARFDGVLELDFRNAAKDRIDSAAALDGDTGGRQLYLSPHLLADLGRHLVLRAGAQIPVASDLHGFQKEHTVADVGLTYLFGP